MLTLNFMLLFIVYNILYIMPLNNKKESLFDTV